MLYLRFLLLLCIVFAFALIDVCAKPTSKVAYLASPRAVVIMPADWFKEFDAIQKESKIPAKDRNTGAVLMMRAVGGLENVRDYAQASVILSGIAARCRAAAERLERMPRINATEPLRVGYADWYRGTARLSEDCIALYTVDAVEGRYRKLEPAEVQLLMQRKKMLEQLRTTCQFAELYVRTRERCPLPEPELFD